MNTKQWHGMRASVLPACRVAVLFLAGTVSAAQAKMTADPATGGIAVDTSRYSAHFDGGTLVYLHNKLRQQVMVDVTLDPEIPVGQRTALYVADAPKTEPYWIFPATDGERRSAVTVAERGRDSVAVTFNGLATALGTGMRFFPEAELTVTVSVAPERGDLLVKTTGASPDHLLVGSAFAYAGLTTRSIAYTTAHSGLRQLVDLKSKEGRRHSVLEWSNMNHGKRLGLRGGLWPAAVTVQASAADPLASFAVWAEDDVPRSKYLIEQGKGNAYVTYEMPPYDDNRQAASVDWRVNVFAGGWPAAAAPFADSLKRRGYVDGRAPWREEISLVIFANGIGRTWVSSMEATFPPEVRHRIIVWLPQSWRTLTNTTDAKTHDAYYWDNNFSEETAADIQAATAAGFRVSGYTNPHYNWGHWNQVIDPDVREIVKGFAALPTICPVGQTPVEYTGNTLAYTPYREHMLRTYQHIFDQLDMSLYMDTTHQMAFDGRGRAVDGLSSYEGALKFFRGARALKRDQFIGSEFLNELAVMGLCADYGLFYDLVWAQGWEKHKAANTHPILGYLYRDSSIQISQRVNPWSYGGERYYHLAEELSERIGTIATSEWPHQNSSPQAKLDTPERQHWYDKLQLYVRRGLRPHFPETWEDGVMSYLKAADGTIFKYLETDFGSKLVEFPKRGKPVLQYARVWKTPTVKAGNGHLHHWIGLSDNGDAIGLDSEARGYMLFPAPDASAEHLRLNALPEKLAIIHAKVQPDIAVVELGPRDRGQEKPALQSPVEGTAGKPVTPIIGTLGVVTDRPLVRVATAHQPAPTLKSAGQREGQYRYELTGEFWGELAFIWREGVFAPFEPTDDYLLPVLATPPAAPGEFFAVLQPFDQRWNADIGGPRNPRPGTVYQVAGTALKTGDQAGNLSFFLTNPSTKGSGLFADTFGGKVEGNEPQPVLFAGVRQPKLDVVGVRHLALRSFPVGEPNVRLTRLEPIRFIRPRLQVSDTAPFDLGQLAIGATATSPPRRLANGQAATAAAGREFATVLYGVANLTSPNPERPDIQETDHVGIVLVGPHADKFSLGGDNRTDSGGIALLGGDGEPGLRGGAVPESETFTVRFNGAPEAGQYTAAVRIVTQAGNLGLLSTGGDGEPLPGLYYLDIPVTVQVVPPGIEGKQP